MTYFYKNIFVKDHNYLILLIFKDHTINICVLAKANNINIL